MKKLIFLLSICLIGGSSIAQLKVDQDLYPYLPEAYEANLNEIETLLMNNLFYDSAFKATLFGSTPKEVLISELPEGNHVQINYEFTKSNCKKNGYGPTLDIIKELTSIFGNPQTTQWQADKISSEWTSNDLIISLNHIELESVQKIVIRLDIKNRALASIN